MAIWYSATMEPSVLYEDDDVVAVNKPAGLVVHADGRTNERTLVDWLLTRYPSLAGVGESIHLTSGGIIERPGIVHRIDRETSGVLIVAKNEDSFLNLKRQFQLRQIEKTYVAFLYGTLKESQGIVDTPIGRSKRDFRRFAVGESAKGTLREAETRYRVLYSNGGYSYVEAYPKTGRTHQLRVHFSSIGHPIVGDRLYAPKSFLERDLPRGGALRGGLGFERLALHARSLSFVRPEGGRITIEAALPGDFEKALVVLRSDFPD